MNPAILNRVYGWQQRKTLMHGNEKIRFGRLLHVDLASGRCSFARFPDDGKPYWGGRGFNAWYLYHHLPEGTDPLSGDNILLMSCGFLTGSSAPASARLHINALSPLTGILGSSNIGGYAGAWLRSCNVASIIITGKAPKPVYLSIAENNCQVNNADSLWGMDTFETQDKLSQIHTGKKIKSLVIGPAGESQVRFAAVLSERDHAAGRTGMGAVMGSKNLKAVVIERGRHKHFPAVSTKQKHAVRHYALQIKESAEFKTFSTLGGAGYLEWVNDIGIMGSKNYAELGVDHVEQLDGKRLKKNIIRASGCYRCPIQCKADLKFGDADQEKRYTRPEFEPIINLGPKCGLKDIRRIIALDNLCNRLGVDSTSAATAIAFAMDLSDKNLLPERFSKGLDLSWGNAGTMKDLLYQMVAGKGLGKILRLGVKKAAAVFGSSTSAFAAHVNGLELTAYHPGAIMGTALGYAVSSRGGDYNNVYASLEYSMTEEEAIEEFGTKEAVDIKKITAKGYLIRKAVITNSLIDCLGLCKVPVLSLLRSFNLDSELALMNDLCDLDLSRESLFDTGLNISTLERKFNIRHAGNRLQDNLPDMFFSKKADPALSMKAFKAMLNEYYTAMGWDENGIPPE